MREALKNVVIPAEIPPIEPERGLVCMGEECWLYRTSRQRPASKAIPPGWCRRRTEGGKCDAIF